MQSYMSYSMIYASKDRGLTKGTKWEPIANFACFETINIDGSGFTGTEAAH